MKWYTTFEQFMKSPRTSMDVGTRTHNWINSFKEDLKRWGFPIRLEVQQEDEYPLVVLIKEEKEPTK